MPTRSIGPRSTLPTASVRSSAVSPNRRRRREGKFSEKEVGGLGIKAAEMKAGIHPTVVQAATTARDRWEELQLLRRAAENVKMELEIRVLSARTENPEARMDPPVTAGRP